MGVVYLCERNLTAAAEAFLTAAREAENFIQRSKNNYDALDTKGLSLCGLAISEKDSNRVKQAKQTYKKARTINRDKGDIKRVLRFFDKLAENDEDGILKGVRVAVSGE